GVDGREEGVEGQRGGAPDRAGPRPAAPHLPPLPALPRLPERRDASLRAGPRGAPPPAPPRGWDVLPRPRGGRGDSQCAGRHRASRGRAGGVRDAAWAVLRPPRRRAAGLPRALPVAEPVS